MSRANDNSILLLAIDDEPAALQLVADCLRQQNLEIITTTDPEDGLEIVRRKHPQIVLLDLKMPKMSGMELLEKIIESDPGTDVFLLTSDYSTESAVEAIQKGACDYLQKPFSVEVLRERIGKSIAGARQRQSCGQLEHEVLQAFQFEGIVGRSPLMLDLFARIRRVAPHYRNILVAGPTGAGKELVASALHRLSPAGGGRFVLCNCSAIVETLFESELFGHVKGAFTGAIQDKAGFFEHANGGTLFLDEIGEMPLYIQAKLLRVLQSREIQRVGSPAVRTVDVRVIAATNRDLKELVSKNLFREDLYYRLAMIEIQLPRLAERLEDLPLLQRYFVERFGNEYGRPIQGITRRAQLLLMRHSWPGNVRELENVLGHACMMANGEYVDIHDLPEYLRRPLPAKPLADDQLITLEEVQRRHAQTILEQVGGNKLRAAEILGISRATLYRLIGRIDSAEPHDHSRTVNE